MDNKRIKKLKNLVSLISDEDIKKGNELILKGAVDLFGSSDNFTPDFYKGLTLGASISASIMKDEKQEMTDDMKCLIAFIAVAYKLYESNKK